MPPAHVYHPVVFYLITILMALALGPLAVYLGHQKGIQQWQLPLLLLGLCVPCITAMVMIYASDDEVLI